MASSETEAPVRTRTYSWDDPLASAAAGAKLGGLEYLHAMQSGELPMPPIMATLGIGGAEFEEGRAVFWVDPAEYHYNPIGVVHGGLAATLCDSAMGCAVQSLLPAGSGYTTLEIKVNFVRPLTRDTGRIRCEGKIVHLGGRVATAEARVTDAAGKLYAHATTTCMVFRPEGAQGNRERS
ncbi:MAG: PaaI family thioesterase [Gemmatimonadetes bacterium]|nr:PaaI family thioesterase [Gemmatimonadota bacterium]